MDGNCRRENVGIFIRKLDHVAVRHVHVGLAQIDGAVGVVIFIEAEDAVFSVVFQRPDETRQPFDILAIGIVDVFDAGGAGIDLKFQPFKIKSVAHARIDEGVGDARADGEHVDMMID